MTSKLYLINETAKMLLEFERFPIVKIQFYFQSWDGKVSRGAQLEATRQKCYLLQKSKIVFILSSFLVFVDPKRSSGIEIQKPQTFCYALFVKSKILRIAS